MPNAVNTGPIDFEVPSLQAIARAITVESFQLPEGFLINEIDWRDCLRPGARKGEVLFSGSGPDEVIDRWVDDDGVEQVETVQTLWGFRVTIDQIGRD
jgi:hypothetical protein